MSVASFPTLLATCSMIDSMMKIAGRDPNIDKINMLRQFL